jgi:hypothetical protein
LCNFGLQIVSSFKTLPRQVAASRLGRFILEKQIVPHADGSTKSLEISTPFVHCLLQGIKVWWRPSGIFVYVDPTVAAAYFLGIAGAGESAAFWLCLAEDVISNVALTVE